MKECCYKSFINRKEKEADLFKDKRRYLNNRCEGCLNISVWGISEDNSHYYARLTGKGVE